MKPTDPMYNVIQADTLNELVFKSCDRLLHGGRKMPSRNGHTLEMADADLYLWNPRNRHLYLKGRKNNLYATIAETFWVLAGEDKLDPLMKFFIPRVVDFSDDGGLTWRGAYGPRIYKHNQIRHVVEMFKRDSLHTRRATMTIWRPDMDTINVIEASGLDDTKDIPCSQWLGYWVRDNLLHCKFQMRSNDAIWGMSHINVFEFTVLQEIILELLKNELKRPDLDLGYYHHSVLSLHIYDPGTAGQARAILEENEEHKLKADYVSPISIGNLETHNMRKFFKTIYDYFCDLIESPKQARTDIGHLFHKWDVPTKGNQLYSYALLVEQFIINKLAIGQVNATELKECLCPDLKNAMHMNKFTPDAWKAFLM